VKLSGDRNPVVEPPFTGTPLIHGGRQPLHQMARGNRPRIVPVLHYRERAGLQISAWRRILVRGRTGPEMVSSA